MAQERAPGPPVFTSAELLAGVRPTVRLNMNLTLTPELPQCVEHRLPENLVKALSAQQDKVLAFLAAGRENQLAFLTDPAGALAKAKVKLGAGELAALRRLQPARRIAPTMPAGVELASLHVEVGKAAEVAETTATAREGERPGYRSGAAPAERAAPRRKAGRRAAKGRGRRKP